MMTSQNSASPAALSIYADLFINRADAFMGVADAGHWTCCRRALSLDVLAWALSGRAFLGLYSVSEIGLSRWICLDLDDSAHSSTLFRVVDHLEDPRGALLEESRRGCHLWLFIEPTPWANARAWGRQLIRRVGLPETEVFPKGPGLNGVRAPLTRHLKDGRIHPFVDVETGEIGPDPWGMLASCVRMRISETLIAPASRTPDGRTGRTDHLALVAEVEQHTRLRFYGRERAIGRCPFHDDRHPSFGVLGGYWKCFAGCGSGGLAAFRVRLWAK